MYGRKLAFQCQHFNVKTIFSQNFQSVSRNHFQLVLYSLHIFSTIFNIVPLSEMCSNVDNLNKAFSNQLNTNLNKLQTKLESLEIQSKSLTDCEEEYTTIQTDLIKFRQAVDIYVFNSHPYTGFLEVFNNQYCN